jgi:hypothetical protein
VEVIPHPGHALGSHEVVEGKSRRIHEILLFTRTASCCRNGEPGNQRIHGDNPKKCDEPVAHVFHFKPPEDRMSDLNLLMGPSNIGRGESAA